MLMSSKKILGRKKIVSAEKNEMSHKKFPVESKSTY